MKVYVDVRALQITETENGLLKVHAKHKQKDEEYFEEAKVVLIASGRGAVIDVLNLEAVGVEHEASGLKVDENLMTNVEGIYAIGDVIQEIPSWRTSRPHRGMAGRVSRRRSGRTQFLHLPGLHIHLAGSIPGGSDRARM